MNRKRWLLAVCGLVLVPVVAMLGTNLTRAFFSGSTTDNGEETSTEMHPCPHCLTPTRTQAVATRNAPANHQASDWPMFGGTPQRNMVNTIDKNVPTHWNVEEGKRKNVKWVAELGNKAYGGPVIADGKIYVGTNNANPRDPKFAEKELSVLMAFNEADGKFLWQITHEFPADQPAEARGEGLCSTPVVKDQRIYYVTPGCVVVCADTAGKVTWTYDMRKQLKVNPFHLGNCSPLVVGDLVMIVTGNGVNEEGKPLSPKAPSFIALDKTKGTLAWQSNLPGENIIEGQWSNPTLATVNGKTQVIFPGGDCAFYGFEPQTGKLIWKCTCNPTPTKSDRELDNYVVSTPVVVGDRLYVGLGMYPENPKEQKFSYFVCLDVTKKGDVSLKSYDAKAAVNKNSALIWAFGGPIVPPPDKGRKVRFGTTISTAAVHDGLVYVSEERGYMHCLDAQTGERYWDHDFKESVWGSPFCVDGKVYVNVEGGDVFVFAEGKKKNILATNSMDETGLHSTPIVANGVLYIVTRSKLFAIANAK